MGPRHRGRQEGRKRKEANCAAPAQFEAGPWCAELGGSARGHLVWKMKVQTARVRTARLVTAGGGEQVSAAARRPELSGQSWRAAADCARPLHAAPLPVTVRRGRRLTDRLPERGASRAAPGGPSLMQSTWRRLRHHHSPVRVRPSGADPVASVDWL